MHWNKSLQTKAFLPNLNISVEYPLNGISIIVVTNSNTGLGLGLLALLRNCTIFNREEHIAIYWLHLLVTAYISTLA